MLQALWTAASGMRNQQTNVDVISNNIANVNTTGYKSETATFKTLLYQTMQSKSTNSDNTQKPISAQVGLGVRTASIASNYTQGGLTETGNLFDLGISGEGFFKVQAGDEILYTRNGSFYTAVNTDGDYIITTSEGYPLLNVNGEPITIDADISLSTITIKTDGSFEYLNGEGIPQELDQMIGLAQFQNPAGLEKTGSSLLRVTDASGEPLEETENEGLKQSLIKQQYLESSNVSVADEMVNLIVAQRAYELNSKAIQSADTMMQQANQLRS